MFLQMNRNKRGMTLDPTKPEGREIQARMVAQADVVIANLPEKALKALGLDYETLTAIKPDIILVTATAFGTTGPYATKVGFDLVAQAMSGAMHLSGQPGQTDPLLFSLGRLRHGDAGRPWHHGRHHAPQGNRTGPACPGLGYCIPRWPTAIRR